MVANNIPVSKGLRDDLSIGYRKAILYADEKIRKWENERAGNAPQIAQGGAQSTETPIDDRECLHSVANALKTALKQ